MNLTENERLPKTGYELFNLLPEGIYCELINDKITMSPSPTVNHQRLVFQLGILLKEATVGRGEVFIAPIDVELSQSEIYMPDLIYVPDSFRDIIKPHRIVGAPGMVIEVISPGTEKVDKTTKKDAYMKAGVLEYYTVELSGKVSCWTSRAKDGNPSIDNFRIFSLLLNHPVIFDLKA